MPTGRAAMTTALRRHWRGAALTLTLLTSWPLAYANHLRGVWLSIAFIVSLLCVSGLLQVALEPRDDLGTHAEITRAPRR